MTYHFVNAFRDRPSTRVIVAAEWIAEAGQEPDAREYVVMQQMERDFMASENTQSKSAVTERKPAGSVRSRPQPAQPSGPPLVHDGLETLRDSHC
jgi:hypothetical protein